MGLVMELEFDKYCVVDRSPKTVLPSPRHSKAEKRKVKGKPRCGNEKLSVNKDFTEISFHRYRSASCRAVPSRLEGNEVQRRSSIYQSSNEIRKSTKKIGGTEGRKKIEFPQSSATAFSFEIVDSLCSSDEDSLESSSFVSKPPRQDLLDLSVSRLKERVLLSDSVDMSLDFDNRAKLATEDEEREKYKFRCDPSVTLPRSLSARLALPHSPCQSESDSSRPTSPKSRFSPIRKMFDPFVKSKSQKSPLGSAVRPGEEKLAGNHSMSRNKTLRKSLLHDFSSSVHDKECDASQYVKKDSYPLVPCSPAHLSGLLKLENKHGVPFFEFSVKNPEDVIVAKTWKVGNALNWVYTFHTAHNRRKSNVTGWGSKDSNKESTMVGQMQVSCYLCTELKDAGAFDNSMVTEFVLYDAAHPRRSDAKPPTGSNESPSVETRDSSEFPDQTKLKVQPKNDNDFLTPCPRAPADLHSDLEIAAIVIQLPFEKRESLKCKRGDWRSDNLLNFSGLELEKKSTSDCSSPAKVNVVTPLGNHGLPITESESRGPSPLLDRWRLGGGCDCGGWDMGCPLVVFGNPNIQYDEDHALLENERPVQLFVQGRKENTPGLTMKVTEEGQYAVDFHAQLTSLQAFSICVAILHSSEASIAIDQERDRQLLQCDSLRVFVEDEVQYLIEEEDKRLGKKMEETLPSFVLNPPFSPIARV